MRVQGLGLDERFKSMLDVFFARSCSGEYQLTSESADLLLVDLDAAGARDAYARQREDDDRLPSILFSLDEQEYRTRGNIVLLHKPFTVRQLQSAFEIINLRSSSAPLERLADQIRESLWNDGRTEGVFTIYRRDGLATDLAVHIRHSEDSSEVPSRLGLRLVTSLAVHLDADMVLVIGATLSASTFGSHACFYSDATVLTAQASGCTPMQHAITQIPYALIAAAITIVGYLLIAYT